tara:strand:- start:479 stop:1138 length:660 start_codon:yes stop_codon:yes gene_type:complete
MAVTDLINPNTIKQELVVFLRNSDVFSTSERGVTTTTDEFDGDDVETEFTLTNTNCKNIRSITIDDVAQSLGTDYTVDYSTAIVTFTSAPATERIRIQYDYGTGDKIYPDFPRVDISISSYPRIAVSITSMTTSEVGLGAKSNISDMLISVTVYSDGMINVDNYIKDIREAFLEAKDDFYYLKFITPITQSPLINEPARGDKIYQRTLELRSLFNLEEI